MTPPTGDELAGVVDLFGALTREELDRALREAAFRADREFDADAAAAAVEDARSSYRLVAVDPGTAGVESGPDPPGDPSGAAGDDAPTVLVVGPTAFPDPPEGARDLPHILDVERRSVDRAAAGRAALSRFRAETARAVDDGDDDRIRELLDVSYDIEAWAPVELTDLRERLDHALDATGGSGA